ncbi:EVE domain-containing protein [Sphingomonas antarctica]|uniref:EVE domain-containing protein n=1 Tax=Sphingomonas antarctica TaxID=2040274 RepID=UPI0039EA6047
MQYWLMKSEPNKYSWDDLVRDKRTVWDGIRNHQVAIWLRQMQLGDQAIFYHSNEGLQAVGIMEIVGLAHPDATDAAGRFVAVDVAPVRPLKKFVPLAAMKAEPVLADMPLFRQFRLSVVQLTDAHWAKLMEMAGER